MQGKLGLKAIALDLEEYDMSELTLIPSLGKNWTAGFFLATYGEGEPTDNAVDFYSWLMDGQGIGDDKGDQIDDMTMEQVLNTLPFFVFALGNKTYEHFNAIGRRVNNRLEACGGKRVHPIGEGDDDASLEEDFLKWKPQFLEAIAKHYGLEQSGSQMNAPHVPLFELVDVSGQLFAGELTQTVRRSWQVKTDDLAEAEQEIAQKHGQGHIYQEQNPPSSYDARMPYYARFARTKSLFKNTFDLEKHENVVFDVPQSKGTVEDSKVKIERKCYHIEFDIAKSGLDYVTGDHVGVWASNDEEKVIECARTLKLDLDQVIQLAPNKSNSMASGDVPFPTPCTVYTALKHYLDINSFLKQHHFEILSKYSSGDEKTKLWKLSQDRPLFLEEIEQSQKTLADIVVEYPSLKIPLPVILCELLPRVAVRYYSISSSSKEQPDRVSVTAVVVRYSLAQTKKNEKRVIIKEGLATSWLQRLSEQFETLGEAKTQDGLPPLYVPLYIRHSSFRMPGSELPVVMVGPGTGVAPFRGFIRERYAQALKGESVGKTVLLYGCRSDDADFLYKDEFNDILRDIKEKQLPFDLQIITAFSRQGPKKVYVQHKMAEHGALIFDLIEKQSGSFYVCGDAKHMAKDVHDQLHKIAQDGGIADASGWVKNLKQQSRYLEDVW
ncbi:hypothetical protein EDD86DRAFT_212150 [Gorgonomyces haynaldii]|nr:hypothetical protein EDD86DRAFT_212150 [Gorgonomyces haynaldii]